MQLTAVVRDKVDASRDFEPWDGPPARSYLLCFTARSGSTLLAQLLWDTGLLGAPTEYLNPDVRELLATRWGSGTSARGYVDALHRHRVSPNGIFGVKAAWHQLVGWHDELRGAPGDAPALDAEVLGTLLPAPQFIRVIRRDLVAQAVSYYVATRTNSWQRLTHGDDGDHPERPPYDFDVIDACLRFIQAEEVAWERFLLHNGIQALTVEYEQLEQDPAPTITAIMRSLGVEPPEEIPAARMARQRTPETVEYADRYREDSATRGRGTAEWLSRMVFEGGLRREANDGGLERVTDLSAAHERLTSEVARLRERQRLLDAILNGD